jgi:hypothetical protein
MKRTLLMISAATALCAAAPAAAQYQTYSNANQGYGNAYAAGTVGIDNRIAQLDARLNAGIQSGAISGSEARVLRRDLSYLVRVEQQYGRDGMSQAERRDLRQRIRMLHARIRDADAGSWDRYDRFASSDVDDDYNRGSQYGSNGYPGYAYPNGAYPNNAYPNGTYPNNAYPNGAYPNNAYPNAGYPSAGYPNNGYYGQGGPYEDVDVCERRGGIGGLIESVFGGGSCLRVGDRASGNLYGVPYEYQNQFRDGNGYYFRSDGRAIYQIDARTNTVVRVYGMNR